MTSDDFGVGVALRQGSALILNIALYGDKFDQKKGGRN